MKSSKTNMLILSVFLGILLFVSACTSEKKEETDPFAEIENVRLMRLETDSVYNTLSLTSTILPYEEVYFAPATPGRIQKINVEAGDRFSKGDLLVVMDQTQLIQAKIQLNALEVDMARFDTLLKTKSIPKQQYDQIKTQYELAQTNVKFLEENSMLYAPFSGVISGKYYQNGEMFSGAPNTQVGKAAVVTLVQINPLKVLVSVTERYFPLIKLGMEVDVVSDIYPDMHIKGKVSRIHPVIDPISRSFQVEITIPNTDDKLRPGMFCRATFFTGEMEVILVPSDAVLKLQGSNERFVFVEENGKAKRVTVELGRRFDERVEIISREIKLGDKIIVSGQSRLVDGVSLNVVK